MSRDQMNKLAVTADDENGLSFVLLVDGMPMHDLLNDNNYGLPNWIAEAGIPTWPPRVDPSKCAYRIITVCPCGEYGCSHSRCKVEISEESVRFFEFAGDCAVTAAGLSLEFMRSEYDSVCAEISERVRLYQIQTDA